MLLATRSRTVRQAVPNQDAPYVLCWLRNALRSEDNSALDAAILCANQLHKPVVVLHEVGGYPYPSYRHHQFQLEASSSLERGLDARGVRFVRHVTPKGETPLVVGLAGDAAALFSDDLPTRAARELLTSSAAQLSIPATAVDTACLVPMREITPELPNPSAFLKAHRPARAPHLETNLTQTPTEPRYEGELLDNATGGGADWTQLIAHSGADMTLPPVKLNGSREAALQQLDWTLETVLPTYNKSRNNPADETSSSQLSPYLHFGILSTREITLRVQASAAHSAAKYKFLDELLKWREFFYHQAHHRGDMADYIHVAAWARETLAVHQHDDRPTLYNLHALTNAQTDDETWNAAQKSYLFDGWMHNNLRMYWGKQFIKWLPDPEAAYKAACTLNDRLSLDGRDPSTYGNIQYMFGGGKKGYKELPVYGFVASKSDKGLRKRPGVPDYLAAMAARDEFES